MGAGAENYQNRLNASVDKIQQFLVKTSNGK